MEKKIIGSMIERFNKIDLIWVLYDDGYCEILTEYNNRILGFFDNVFVGLTKNQALKIFNRIQEYRYREFDISKIIGYEPD